jgi:hypothetical protein
MSSSAVPNLFKYQEILKNYTDCHMLIVIFLGSINWYDIFHHCNWVTTRWQWVQYTFTHKQYIEWHKNIGRGRAVPHLCRFLPWHLPWNWGKSTKNLSQCSRIHRIQDKKLLWTKQQLSMNDQFTHHSCNNRGHGIKPRTCCSRKSCCNGMWLHTALKIYKMNHEIWLQSELDNTKGDCRMSILLSLVFCALASRSILPETCEIHSHMFVHVCRQDTGDGGSFWVTQV